MKIVHKNNVKTIDSVSFSWASALLGTTIFAGWAYAIYWLHTIKAPGPVLWLQYICYPIFILINLKQYKNLIAKKVLFLLGFTSDEIILPLNYSIKTPIDKFNNYLQLKKSEIKSIKLVYEKRFIAHREAGSLNKEGHIAPTTRVILSRYIEIALAENLNSDIIQSINENGCQQGIQGGPIFPKTPTLIQYHFTSHRLKNNTIKKMLRKHCPGVFQSKEEVRKSDLSRENANINLLFEEARRLHYLGEKMLLKLMLDYQRHNFSAEELEEFKFEISHAV